MVVVWIGIFLLNAVYNSYRRTRRPSKDAAAGMVSFRVPIIAGTTPTFDLQRDGKTVEHLESATPIKTTMVYQDLMYHAGGGRSCARD